MQHILAVPALVGLVAASALAAALLPVDRERKKPSGTSQHLENGLSSCFIRLDALATEIAGTGLAASAYHHRFWN